MLGAKTMYDEMPHPLHSSSENKIVNSRFLGMHRVLVVGVGFGCAKLELGAVSNSVSMRNFFFWYDIVEIELPRVWNRAFKNVYEILICCKEFLVFRILEKFLLYLRHIGS